MDVTIPLTDKAYADLKRVASREGMSIEQVAKLAIYDFLSRRQHRERISHTADAIMLVHGDALNRLGH